MTEDSERDALDGVSKTLWAERHLVELLLFKLVTAKLLLAADERRFIPQALEEVERVLDALREAELRRDMAVAAVAEAWELPSAEVTLARLAETAPEPLRDVFNEHREAFMVMAEEIEQTTAENRRLASAALNDIQETLNALTGPEPVQSGYDASGRVQPTHSPPVRLDRSL